MLRGLGSMGDVLNPHLLGNGAQTCVLFEASGVSGTPSSQEQTVR